MSDTPRLDDLKIDRPNDDLDRRRGSGFWLGLVAVVVVVSTAAWWMTRPKPVEVQTTIVLETTSNEPAAVLNATGYVTARRQATVSSKVTGKIVEVSIEEGMEVEADQLLARLDAASQTKALALVEAQVDAAESAREETRVRLADARRELSRAEALLEQEISSEQAVDRARAEVDALAARLAARETDLAVVERQREIARQNLDDTEIRAPFAGVVITKNAQPGEMISPVSAGGGFTRTGIGTIVDMSSLEIEVDVNEAYINRVSPDQPVEAVLDAYTDWTIPAHVIAIVPAADRQKATVRVRIGFDALDPRILPDMGVKVAFIDDTVAVTGAPTSKTTIPRDALRRDGENDVVFVVQGSLLERRAVTVGSALGDRIEVVSGVAAGERVVVTGPEELTEGINVKEITP